MDGYVNPLNPIKLPAAVSSGQNSLQGALKNGTPEQVKFGSAETNANHVSGNNTDEHTNAITGAQEIQSQLEELQRSVTIVFWHKAKAEPIRLLLMIPTFPLFQLSRFSSLISDLGLSPTSYLDTYNPQSGQWEQHTISSVRTVETKQRLLYKVRKTLLEGLSDDECLSLHEEVKSQLKPSQLPVQPSSPLIPMSNPSSTTSASNANTHGAYSSEKGSLKRQAQGTPDSTPAIKHRVMNGYYTSNAMASTSTSSGEGASFSTPTAQLVSTIPSPGPTSPNQNQNTNYIYQTPSFYSTTSASGVPLPPYLIHPHPVAPVIPYHPHPPLKRWPNDYTVSELTTGFHAMEVLISQSPNGSTMTQRTAFERVFGGRYVKSTVCRHRGVWRKAHPSIREEFEAMGDNERACWGEFVRRVEGRPPGRVGQGTGAFPVLEAMVREGHAGSADEGALPPNGNDVTNVTGHVQEQPKQERAEEEEEAAGQPVMDSLQNPADHTNKANGNTNVYDPALTNS